MVKNSVIASTKKISMEELEKVCGGERDPLLLETLLNPGEAKEGGMGLFCDYIFPVHWKKLSSALLKNRELTQKSH